jgi:hypothetical protein
MPLVVASKKLIKFDPKTFLSTINGGGRKIAAFSKKQTIFVQGDSADAVFYIQKGKVKLTVVSKTGKEATIGILNEGDFFGEGCLNRADSPPMLRNRNDRWLRDENREEVHGGGAAPGVRVFRNVRSVLVGTEHPIRRGFGGSTLQFQRKEISSDPAVAGSLRQGRRARDSNCQYQSGDPRRDDRHDSLAGELFHEQV